VKHRAVSLFSNCGAGDVGYKRAGFEFEVMAELDPRRLEVALLNHPGAMGVAGDLRTTWKKVVTAYRARAGNSLPSLLCACPPCQGMSSARSGKGRHEDADAGSKDQRNLLVTVIANVAEALRPALLVVENVPAFLTRKVRHPKDGKPVSAATYLIERLAKEYVAFPMVADLSSFGVPQSRQRAFLTFVRRDLKGLVKQQKLGRCPYPRPTHDEARAISLADALRSFGLPSLDAGDKVRAGGSGGLDKLHVVPNWDERLYRMVASIPPGTGRSAWENDVCCSCGRTGHDRGAATCSQCGEALPRPTVTEVDGSIRLVRGFATSYRRMHLDRPAATITTASGHVGSDYTIHPTENRLLSMRECALLQTFPRSFKWGDALERWGHTNVREMIGEAVPPAFTFLHGQVLRGLLSGQWKRAPISASDDRCTKAWHHLASSAAKDGRENPARFVHGALPPARAGKKSCRPSSGREARP
jgi:DNA (cytosine-5)-methyltransferase 1